MDKIESPTFRGCKFSLVACPFIASETAKKVVLEVLDEALKPPSAEHSTGTTRAETTW